MFTKKLRLVKKNPYLCTLVVIAVFSHLSWFNPTSVLTFSDWYYWPNTPTRELWSSWGPWLSFWNTGAPNIQLPFVVFTSIWSLLVNTGISSFDFAARLTFYIPIALLGFLAPYYLIKKLTSNELVAFTAALFYGSTIYFLVRQTAHLPIAMVFSLAPLLLLLFIYALGKNTLRSWLWFSLLYSLGIVYEVRIMLILTFILVIYFLMFIKSHKLNSLWPLLVSLLTIVGLNIYWLLSAVLGGNSNMASVATRGLFGSNLFDIFHAFTAVDSSWTGSIPNQKFIAQTVPFYAWIIPLLAFSVYFYRKKYSKKEIKLILFFSLIALIGIFLTKQAGQPMPGAYAWLYNNLPGFYLFREASKFYIFTAIGYCGLLSFLLLAAYRTKRRLYYIIVSIVIVTSLINLKPLFTGEIQTLFVNRHMPADYSILQKFIDQQPDYFRTYWMPVYSRWGIYSLQHPKMSSIEMVQGAWSGYGNSNAGEQIRMPGDQTTDLLTKAYAQGLFKTASIKYVVVPLEDIANDDNFFPDYGISRNAYIQALDKTPWLKRIDIGTKDIVVYENSNYTSHISPQARLINVDSFENLNLQSSFLKKIGTEGANFSSDKQPSTGASSLQSLFITPDIATTAGKATLTETTDTKAGQTKLYKNTGNRNLFYAASNRSIQLYTQYVKSPLVNGRIVDFPSATDNTNIASVSLSPKNKLSLILDGLVVPVKPGKTINLGNIGQHKNVGFYSYGPNQIPNGSFEKGLWQPTVSDCNNYDNNGKIAASLSNDVSDGKKSLQLEAVRHTACMGTSLSVQSDTQNILSFDYKSPNSKRAGYSMTFNDSAKTVISSQIDITSSSWQSFSDVVKVPAGATKTSVVLYAYESGGKANNIVRYDNVAFQQTKLEQSVALPRLTDKFVGLPVGLNAQNSKFSLDSSDVNTANLIVNPSFEDGPWNPEVGDCNNYDTNGKLAQRIDGSKHTDGKQSLQLEAVRHTACTSTSLDVGVSGDYNLRFDYQSSNSKQAGYNLQFNDPAKTVISNQLAITSSGWQHLNKIIKMPVGATAASLGVYAYESDGTTNNIVHYDNFHFNKIPDLSNTYYLLTDPKVQLAAPKQVAFTSLNPTKQSIQITAASKPFLLSFAESYNPGWKLYLSPMKPAKPCTRLTSSVPIHTQPATESSGKVVECQGQPGFEGIRDIGLLNQAPVFDSAHIKLNGFANGWVVDPAYVKAHYSKKYYRENADGNLDLNLAIYFRPQSYFDIGLIISGLTLISCLGFLTYVAVKRKKNRPASSKRAKHPVYAVRHTPKHTDSRLK